MTLFCGSQLEFLWGIYWIYENEDMAPKRQAKISTLNWRLCLADRKKAGQKRYLILQHGVSIPLSVKFFFLVNFV